MFHRVLSREDVRWRLVDPEWTVTEQFFQQCLDFFATHYNIISSNDLLRRPLHALDLPERSLIITFDDGWADFCEYGLPALQQRSIPATVFVVAGEVGGREPWQDTVRRAWRRGRLIQKQASEVSGADEVPARQLQAELDEWIERLSGMTVEQRDVVLARLQERSGDATPRQMMSREQVLQVSTLGCQVGSHGLTHTSIPLSPTPWEELDGSRRKLAVFLNGTGYEDAGPAFFSFPNGRYHTAALQMAAAAGYLGIFTSDPCLNVLPSDCFGPLVLGRIHISAGPLSDEHGHLRPELLALKLFLRPIRAVRSSEIITREHNVL